MDSARLAEFLGEPRWMAITFVDTGGFPISVPAPYSATSTRLYFLVNAGTANAIRAQPAIAGLVYDQLYPPSWALFEAQAIEEVMGGDEMAARYQGLPLPPGAVVFSIALDRHLSADGRQVIDYETEGAVSVTERRGGQAPRNESPG